MIRSKLMAALAAGFLLAGCASSAPSSAPAQTAPASVPAASESAPATSAAAPAGNDIDAFMGKVVEAQKGVKTYTINMTMETVMLGKPQKISMKGTIDQTDRSNINMEMKMDLGEMGEMTSLKVDGDMYIKMAALGGHWMKVPKSQMAQYESTTDSADITAGMEKAKSAMKSITLVGDEAVEGVPAHHYRITVDAKGLSKISGSSDTIADSDFDYDVWIDDASLLRKVAMDVMAKADGDNVPMKMNGIMSHYNEPVSIKAPDPKDVVEMGK